MTRRVVSVALAALLLLGLVLWLSGGAARKDADVLIPAGSSVTAAANILEREGVIASADRLLLHRRLFGPRDPIKPGEYRIRAGMGFGDILALLESGRVVQRFVAVPEGLPAVLVHERLLAAPLLTGAVAVPAEGSVLPDNYAYTRGEARTAVLSRMQQAMTREVDRLWSKRKPGLPIASKAEAVTLASIVEKETGRPDERRQVAAVYINRLRIGMPLQADPTLIYPVTRGRPLGRRILRSEISGDTPYNTYTRRGLPPGPITNPGRAAIAAVLDPAPIKALYFVAQPGGHSAFAETLPEHNANVQRWYAYRRARGEM